VNPLEFEGGRYIVAPRGQTQWVRNLRASGEGRLRKGRKTEEFTATELPDEEKPLLLRAYLKKWAWEVGAFFQGVGADAPDEQRDEHRRRERIAPEGDQAVHGGRIVNCPDMLGTVAKLYKEMLNARGSRWKSAA